MKESKLGLAESGELGQHPGVSEMNDSARRWSGYVCPDCRFVFRVPRDHDGRGLVCPSCRRLLRIPGTGDVPPPLVAEFRRVPADSPAAGEAEAGESADGTTGGGESEPVEHRKRAAFSADAPHQMSREHGTHGSSRFHHLISIRMRWMLGGMLLLGLLITGVVLALRNGPGDDTIKSGTLIPKAPAPPPGGEAGLGKPSIGTRSEASILAEAESLAKEFLTATTIDQLLPVVRNPQQAKPRMEREYPDGRIVPLGMAAFNPNKELVRGDPELEVSVRLQSFEVRQLSLVETPGGLKIDWESWVGWCEMGWPEFFATLPTVAQECRVVAKKVDYYNFGFSDDSKWRSYRLESRTGEQTMFGYVERGSDMDGKIQILPELKQASLILKIRFPAGAKAGSKQVLIDEVVNDSWVAKDP